MHLVNDEMQSGIAECLRCYQTCLSTAMGHCLEIGGQHTEPQHFSLMSLRRDLPDVRAFHAARLGTTHRFNLARHCAF